MIRYYCTFAAGFEQVAADILKKRARGAKAVRALGGALLFEHSDARAPYLDCFHNGFQVLHEMKSAGARPLERAAHALLEVRNLPLRRARGTFRLVVSDENRPSAIDAKDRAGLEARIARATGLRLSRGGADEEFWLIKRREGMVLFLRRLPARPGARVPEKGELRGDIAYMLVHLTGEGASGLIVDPFCGHGAIPMAALRYQRFRSIYALDTDRALIGRLQIRAAEYPRLTARVADAFELSSALLGQKADAIVTDPPWGDYRELGRDHVSFLSGMLDSFEGALNPGARVVILTARARELQSVLNARGERFFLRAVYPVLISGKKASVFCLDFQ